MFFKKRRGGKRECSSGEEKNFKDGKKENDRQGNKEKINKGGRKRIVKGEGAWSSVIEVIVCKTLFLSVRRRKIMTFKKRRRGKRGNVRQMGRKRMIFKGRRKRLIKEEEREWYRGKKHSPQLWR